MLVLIEWAGKGPCDEACGSWMLEKVLEGR
jgi:hypothetical protein